MNKTEIGENAGKVWKTINENGAMPFTSLKKLTGFDEKQLIMALGWLAREEKIYQTNPFEKNWEICIIYN